MLTYMCSDQEIPAIFFCFDWKQGGLLLIPSHIVSAGGTDPSG